MPKQSPDQSIEEAVETYLHENPTFLASRPKLLVKLMEGLAAGSGGNVADLQRFALTRLRDELEESHEALAELVVLSRDYLAQLEQVHQLAVQLMISETLDDMLDALSEMPSSSLVDAVVLAIESDIAKDLPAIESPIKGVPSGTVASWLGEGLARAEQLPPPDNTLFGPATGLVDGFVLMRLDVPAIGRPAMLGLGARDASYLAGFHGTALWRFLARVVEHRLNAVWPRK